MTDTRPTLPAFSLDYSAGTFTNTLTGEQFTEITAVVLAQREGRVLWPSSLNPDPRPECVDGSKYGPCQECRFADWGENGEPPVCSEELTLLLWLPADFQLVELTARRSQVRVIEQWLGMKAMLSGILHDQEVTVSMKPGDGLHHLVLLPGRGLEEKEVGRMNELVVRAERFGFEGL
ncbi:hypothetical protein [Deinococcus radiodurans]|mgnify:CR=1 FL=1|jgi:hypothetical protein|uniref:Uncharacterized protein n=1 Tax=Deinococcus radiodurans (strain ATCC 13939 / DSM 20539 / JCM 16871 / CCUG 27074 / LMG 4051 / NBRC 15346 / NCIMB 9279 / VKM B-1422 / R1) TaxID=243230 RepID=Q9RZ68_DEIRA|nr:hypothetical protein [Deinococcus radiodurans]AAF12342.1 hypothetical protein DR_A0086 [Deinococcus radiodurans R1 = ATCC 13939 = DSM 20539]ANC72946.1 hypothetical protein A2G07_13920 [Deinococcus radiodurans R1 = ATCC 13939 = DSM 20539]QEM72904.1 hypothetical protein DXG80_13890 [Deinococcus radiodurans]QIP30417.1 hypothetical protein HAV23_14285 [Deinococcus radiodurans]QIP33224.1 hypothetical protein HAV35_13705 [Deinococcus radiodurans]